jgi:hypothetical protein
MGRFKIDRRRKSIQQSTEFARGKSIEHTKNVGHVFSKLAGFKIANIQAASSLRCLRRGLGLLSETLKFWAVLDNDTRVFLGQGSSPAFEPFGHALPKLRKCKTGSSEPKLSFAIAHPFSQELNWAETAFLAILSKNQSASL